METSEQRLNQLLAEISVMCLESKDKLSLEKKFQIYNKSNILISEASKLIEAMEKEISNIDTSKVDNTQMDKAHQFIDLLSSGCLNFDQIIYVVQQLKLISIGLPCRPKITDHIDRDIIKITDHIDRDIIYEEQDI